MDEMQRQQILAFTMEERREFIEPRIGKPIEAWLQEVKGRLVELRQEQAVAVQRQDVRAAMQICRRILGAEITEARLEGILYWEAQRQGAHHAPLT